MKKEEEWVLMLEAAKEIVKDVDDALRTYLHDPVKAWLEAMPAQVRRDGVEVEGLVKAYIQEDRAKDIPDVAAISADVKALSAKEIKELIDRGLIDIALIKPEEVAGHLQAGGSKNGYTKHVPGGGRQALRTLVLNKGKWTGISTLVRKPLLIGDQIRDLALKSQAKAIQAALQPGQVTINAKPK